jgi:ribonucleoside-diphosphate reductase alpha chain
MDSFGTAISMSLQYRVPLEVLVNKFSHTRFEPQGHTTNPDIRVAKSVVDYIFRWLGVTFLPGFREANGLPPQEKPSEHVLPAAKAEPPAAESNGHANGEPASGSAAPPANGAAATNGNGKTHAEHDVEADLRAIIKDRNDQSKEFQTDAPSCDNCGNLTIRNGNCYLCHNCGNSMGCS